MAEVQVRLTKYMMTHVIVVTTVIIPEIDKIYHYILNKTTEKVKIQGHFSNWNEEWI
jgi:hypothetical protein